MILEVCANSYESAINAEKSGAHRIELCENLAVGGLTPNYKLAKKVISDLSIPVFILIRPRDGDFNYSKNEFEQIKKDIILFKDLGCKGIVSGILTKDKNLDIKNTVIVKDGNKHLKKSEAVILMLDKINFKKTSFFIKIFPSFIRNLVYDFIARYRYNIFGKIK